MPDAFGKHLERILESAIHAPSADNHLRVRFQIVSDEVVNILATEPALSQRTGYRRILAFLSLGAVVESVAISARDGGFDPHTDLQRSGDGRLLKIRVTLHPSDRANDPLARYIRLRHTNRRPWFRGPELGEIDRDALAAEATSFAHVDLSWLNGRGARNEAARLIGKAESERFRNRALHEELFSSIRFSNGWEEGCAEGIPSGSLAVEPVLRPVFSTLRHWPIMRLANVFGAHRALGLRAAAWPSRIAPDLAAITVTDFDERTILAAGRAMMRIWLHVTGLGRVLQPLPAAALYAAAGAPDDEIPTALRDTLAAGWHRLLDTRAPVMLLRIGNAAPLRINAGRPPIAFFMVAPAAGASDAP